MGCPQPNGPFSIFTGDQKLMPLRIAYASGLPVDLSAVSEIAVNLTNADGSVTQLTLTSTLVTIVSPSTSGQFNASISSINSAKLQIGELQDVDVTFTIGGSPFTVRFYGALSVYEAG